MEFASEDIVEKYLLRCIIIHKYSIIMHFRHHQVFCEWNSITSIHINNTFMHISSLKWNENNIDYQENASTKITFFLLIRLESTAQCSLLLMLVFLHHYIEYKYYVMCLFLRRFLSDYVILLF